MINLNIFEYLRWKNYNYDRKEYYILLLYNFSTNSVVPRASKLVIARNVEVINKLKKKYSSVDWK